MMTRTKLYVAALAVVAAGAALGFLNATLGDGGGLGAATLAGAGIGLGVDAAAAGLAFLFAEILDELGPAETGLHFKRTPFYVALGCLGGGTGVGAAVGLLSSRPLGLATIAGAGVGLALALVASGVAVLFVLGLSAIGDSPKPFG